MEAMLTKNRVLGFDEAEYSSVELRAFWDEASGTTIVEEEAFIDGESIGVDRIVTRVADDDVEFVKAVIASYEADIARIGFKGTLQKMEDDMNYDPEDHGDDA